MNNPAQYLLNMILTATMLHMAEGGETPPGDEGGETPPGDEGGETPPGDEGGETPSKDDEGAPEAYADFTMPEGIEIDTKAVEVFAPKFKELGLSQEQAQGLVNIQAGLVKAREGEAQSAYEDTVKGWEDTVKADKNLGGDNYNETKRLSALALAKVPGGEGLSAHLDTYGTGSQPDMVKFLTEVGKMVDEDGPGTGGDPVTDPKPRHEIMYPPKS